MGKLGVWICIVVWLTVTGCGTSAGETGDVDDLFSPYSIENDPVHLNRCLDNCQSGETKAIISYCVGMCSDLDVRQTCKPFGNY